MARKKVAISLQEALRRRSGKWGQESTEKLDELISDVIVLSNTLEGQELIDAVIARIQRHAAESVNLSVDTDFMNIGQDKLDSIEEIIRDRLGSCVTLFISDEHREFMVRHHAHGISTTDAVSELIRKDDGMTSALSCQS